MAKRNPPEILAKQTVAQSRLFSIEALDLRFSNGEQRTYERMKPSGRNAVMMVPVTEQGDILLVREYAAGVERYELGLPKGRTEVGESILDAANRELKEEVGYGANRLHHLTSVSIAPGYLEHMTEIVMAQDLYEEKLPGDEPEELEVVPWGMDHLNELFNCGECTEARSIAALFLIKEYLKNAG